MSAARAPAPSAPSSAPAVTQAAAPAVLPLLCSATRTTGAGHEVACVHVTCGAGGAGGGGGGGSCSDDGQDNKKHYDVDRLSATTTTAPAPTHPLLQFAPFRTAKTRHVHTPNPPPPSSLGHNPLLRENIRDNMWMCCAAAAGQPHVAAHAARKRAFSRAFLRACA